MKILAYISLAAMTALSSQTVDSPLGSVSNYTFTIPYCGTNGIHGRIMSMFATNSPVRVEDRAFLAEAAAERSFYAYVGHTNAFANATTNYQSRWRFHDGEYHLAAAYSRTNATYSPTLVELTGGNFGPADMAAALGTDLDPITNATLRLALVPSNSIHLIVAAPVKAAYTNFIPFRTLAGAAGTARLRVSYTDTSESSGTPFDDSRQSSTSIYTNTVDIALGGQIYAKGVYVSKQKWAFYKGANETWSLDGQGTETGVSVQESEYTLLEAVDVPLYSTNASPESVKQCAAIFKVTLAYLKPTPHQSAYTPVTHDFAYAVPASVVHRADGVFASVNFSISTLLGAAVSAAGATIPDKNAVEAEITLPGGNPLPPQGPAIEDARVLVYGASGDARSTITLSMGACHVVVDIEPKALHPQWNMSQPQ